MAENNLEITYIPYGLDEISQLDLITNLANGVEGYLGSKRWARKDKYRNAWLAAYLDIISRGLTGASNDNGIWTINHNGEAIPLDSKSNVEREMYQDAAYYIQLQMAKMTPRKKEEEKKKEDLTPFKFKESFTQLLLNNRFGGDPSLFSDAEQGWNTLDVRDEKTGLRGTEKRREAIASELESYLKTIEDGKFNFEGTSFKDENDARTKILAAINALRDTPKDESDDIPAFSALGLNYRGFFSNGGNEASTHINPATNTPFTYNEWNLYQLQLAEAKAKLEAETTKLKLAQQKANRYLRFRFHTGTGMTPQQLSKYSDLIGQLNTYNTGAQLTQDLKNELIGTFLFAAKNNQLENLSKEELSRFGSGYSNNPTRLKKLKGLEGFYWDSIGNRVIQPFKDVQNALSFLDLINLNNPELMQLKINNTPRGKGVELTAADKRDIYATLADLGAVINPEVFSGTAMALSASGARTWNSIELNGLWDTFTDWKTWADWGTGALGGTMLLGDASSAVKFVRGLGKLMTLPAIGNALLNMPEAKAAWDKIDLKNPIESAKNLTPQDYHALSSFLIGIVSGKNYLKGNLAERRVLQESGVNILAKTKRREYLNKVGITRTKPNNLGNLTEIPILKIKKTGKDGKVEEREIEITRDLQNTLLNTKPSKLNEEAKRLLGDKIPEGFEVSRNTNWSRSKINAAKSVIGKGNSEIFGKPKIETSETPRLDNFETWLNSRSTWDLYKPWSLGTNSNLRKVRNNIFGKDFDKSELISSASGEESPYARKPLELGEVKKSNHIEELPNRNSDRETTYRKEVMKRYKDVMSGKFSNKEMENIKEGIKIGNENVRVYNTKDAHGNSLISVFTSKGTLRFKSQEEAKKFIASLVKELRNNITSGKITKENIKEIGKVLLELKRKGWLKQGGQINPSLDTIIEDFIKNNNI